MKRTLAILALCLTASAFAVDLKAPKEFARLYASPTPPSGLILQVQNGGSTIATWVAFGVLNCSTGMTCTASGSTVSMTAAGGAAYNQGTIDVIGNGGSAQTINPSNGAIQTITLNAATLTIGFTQPTGGSGSKVMLKITQAAGGSDAITWTSVKWPGGIAPVMTATANAVDWYSCVLDGTNTYCTAGQSFQ